MENKELRVNMGKTKVIIFLGRVWILYHHLERIDSVCRKGVGRNSIFCTSWDAWVHKKCSGIKSRLFDIPEFKCHRRLYLARPLLMVDLLNIFHSEIKN